MASIQLPHTLGCLVCGRDNPHGLRLDLQVDPESRVVRTTFTPDLKHIGFEGIIHGGVLATVLDEAMVWAATWALRKFCVCAEMTVRYLHPAAPGEALSIEAKVTSARSRLIVSQGSISNVAGRIIAASTGKFTPISPQRNRDFLATLVENDRTRTASAYLRLVDLGE